MARRRRLALTLIGVAVLGSLAVLGASSLAHADRERRDRRFASSSAAALAAWHPPAGFVEVRGATCPAGAWCETTRVEPSAAIAASPGWLASLGTIVASDTSPGFGRCAAGCSALFGVEGRGGGWTVSVQPAVGREGVDGTQLLIVPWGRAPTHPWYDRL